MYLGFKKSFTILELSFALLVITIFIFLVVNVSGGQKKTARAIRTKSELQGILQASGNYYDKKGCWPDSFSDLQKDGFISKTAVDCSPFGNKYIITKEKLRVIVSTTLPSNIINKNLVPGFCVLESGANEDTIRVSKSVFVGETFRLKYDKKYLYQE